MKKIVVNSIMLLLLIIVCYAMGKWLIPFVVSLVLAYAFHIPTRKLASILRISNSLASSIVIFFLILVCALFAIFMTPMIKNAITIAIAKLPYFIEIVPKIINEIVLKFSTVLRIDSQTTLDISQTLIKYLSGVKITIPNYFFGFLNTSMTLVYIAIFAFMVPIITFYLLRDWEKIERYGEFLLKKMSSKSITNVVRNINKNLGSYIIGQITVCIILAALYTICLYFIGLKEYIFCGLFSGFMSFTPFLGPLIGFTSTAVIAIDQYTTMQYMLTAAIYVILPFVDSNYLTPKLIGARVGIQPFWILFSICATVSIIGISGVFISVPIAVVAATIYKDFIKNL